MDQAASPPQHAAPPDGRFVGRFGKFAAAFMIGIAALSAAISRGNDERTIVSLMNIDTAIVLPLPRFDPPPRHYAAIAPMDDDDAPPAVQPVVGFVHARGTEPGAADIASRTLATIIGIASTYNPFRARPDVDAALTASGETYGPDGWTAAIQIDLRNDFGGVRYGRFYRPTFALLERGDKRAIVRINDVGPLRPGRVIDLNERSMRHFDPSLRLGLVHDMKITLLAGNDWKSGPIETKARFGLASAR